MTQTLWYPGQGSAQQLDWGSLFGQPVNTPANSTMAAFSTPTGANAPSTPSSVGFNNNEATTNHGAGRTMGMVGTALGMGIGIPGLGVIGSIAGNEMERQSINAALANAAAANPGYDFGRLGFMDTLSGALNGMTFGALGNSLSDSMTREATRSVGQPGVPGVEDPQSMIDAQSSTGSGGGSRDGTATSSDPGPGGIGNGGNAWAKGGAVTAERLRGANPPGPDDGTGKLDIGEFIVNKMAAKHYGPQLMMALNNMAIPKDRLMMALQ